MSVEVTPPKDMPALTRVTRVDAINTPSNSPRVDDDDDDDDDGILGVLSSDTIRRLVFRLPGLLFFTTRRMIFISVLEFFVDRTRVRVEDFIAAFGGCDATML